MSGESWEAVRQDYLRDVAASSKPAVIDSRRRYLRHFSDWLDEQEFDWDDIEPREARRYIYYLVDDEGYDEWSMSQRVTSIQHCYKWLRTRTNVDVGSDPWRDIKISEYRDRRADKPRIEAELGGGIRRFSHNQIEQIMDNIPEPETRNRLIWKIMLNTGIRPGEIEGIRLDDIDFDEREIWIREFKQSEARPVWYPRSMSTLLRKWVYQKRSSFTTSYESDRLFLTKIKGKMSGDSVDYTTRKTLHYAGLITAAEFADEDEEPDPVYVDQMGRNRYAYSAHVARHTYAMEFLEARGADAGSVFALKELLGHRDITTTADTYLRHVNEQALKQSAKKYNPDF